MRTWHDWSSEEKALFERLVRTAWKHAEIHNVAELERLKLEMFARPLTTYEISNANNMLQAIEMGLETHGVPK